LLHVDGPRELWELGRLYHRDSSIGECVDQLTIFGAHAVVVMQSPGDVAGTLASVRPRGPSWTPLQAAV
jgi:hypothetical protein